MRICFTIGKKTYCIEIPVLYDPLWKLRRPFPWLTLRGKGVDISQDLQILASIVHLSRELSPALGRTLQAGIDQAASTLQGKLPEGAELHFSEQAAK